MIKNNKLKIIISSIVTLIPMLAGIILWNKLPDAMTIHWGADGVADGTGGKAMVVFVMPLIFFALHLLCIFFTAIDKRNKHQSKKIMGLIYYIMPVFSMVIGTITYSVAFEKTEWMTCLIAVFLGFLFIVMGNYMPKCKQNYTIGIKMKWTLTDEENWNATHRFAGKLWVACGVLMLIFAFLPTEIFFISMIVIVLVSTVPVAIYSYAFHRKQVKEGKVSEETNIKAKKYNKQIGIGVTIGLTILAVVMIIILGGGDIEVAYGEDSFTVVADFFEDLTIKHEEIADVEYRESFDKGSRLFGFGSPRLSMGSFQNEEFGRYDIISYTGCKAVVIITSTDGKKLALNLSDKEATRELYEDILDRIGETEE